MAEPKLHQKIGRMLIKAFTSVKDFILSPFHFISNIAARAVLGKDEFNKLYQEKMKESQAKELEKETDKMMDEIKEPVEQNEPVKENDSLAAEETKESGTPEVSEQSPADSGQKTDVPKEQDPLALEKAIRTHIKEQNKIPFKDRKEETISFEGKDILVIPTQKKYQIDGNWRVANSYDLVYGDLKVAKVTHNMIQRAIEPKEGQRKDRTLNNFLENMKKELEQEKSQNGQLLQEQEPQELSTQEVEEAEIQEISVPSMEDYLTAQIKEMDIDLADMVSYPENSAINPSEMKLVLHRKEPEASENGQELVNPVSIAYIAKDGTRYEVETNLEDMSKIKEQPEYQTLQNAYFRDLTPELESKIKSMEKNITKEDREFASGIRNLEKNNESFHADLISKLPPELQADIHVRAQTESLEETIDADAEQTQTPPAETAAVSEAESFGKYAQYALEDEENDHEKNIREAQKTIDFIMEKYGDVQQDTEPETSEPAEREKEEDEPEL